MSLVALVIDRATKAWAQVALADGQSREVVPGVLSLTLVRNPGASLGLGSSVTWLISVLAAIACVAIVILAWRTTSLVWTVVLALAFAGAAGNLIDRVIYAQGFLDGKVVDFLDYGWSVGNVADVYLVFAGIAIACLIIASVPLVGGHETQVGESSSVGAKSESNGDGSYSDDDGSRRP